MLLELFFALLLGILFGAIAGLLPGVHVNLISVFLISILPFFLNFLEPIALVVFVVAMSLSDTFISFIPSIFLGAPDEDTTLSILPGHQLLLQGKAHQAVLLTLHGSILAIPIILIFTPAFLFVLPKIFSSVQLIMFLILIIASIFLIATEKTSKPLALIIFLLAGFLGISNSYLPIQQPLLPLLTGLFGGSGLIISIIKKQKIPKQKIIKFKQAKTNLFKPTLASIISAPLCAFLPSLGSGQAAVIGSGVINLDKKQFLILLGSINTIVAGLAFIALFSIQRARTGAAIAVSQLISNLTPSHLLIILITIITSALISIFLTIKLSKLIAVKIHKFNYQKLSIIILIFLIIMVLIISSWLGLLIFIVSTFLGLSAILLNIRRTHLMGALMIPTILFYLPF